MNRVLRVALASAAVLLSGTVAFAVAVAVAPPGADHVKAVVTNRPILTGAATSPANTSVRPGTPAAPQSTAPGTAPRTTATPVPGQAGAPSVGATKRPRVTAPPVVTPRPPSTASDSTPDHEVVTPPVRDDDADYDADSSSNGSSAPSAYSGTQASRGAIRAAGSKGDS